MTGPTSAAGSVLYVVDMLEDPALMTDAIEVLALMAPVATDALPHLQTAWLQLSRKPKPGQPFSSPSDSRQLQDTLLQLILFLSQRKESLSPDMTEAVKDAVLRKDHPDLQASAMQTLHVAISDPRELRTFLQYAGSIVQDQEVKFQLRKLQGRQASLPNCTVTFGDICLCSCCRQGSP